MTAVPVLRSQASDTAGHTGAGQQASATTTPGSHSSDF